MPEAFRSGDVIWTAGQPLDPTAKTLGPQELTDRLLYIEKVLDKFDVDNIDVGALQRKMEQTWIPDPQTLFASGTIGFDSLVFALIAGRVGSTGTKLQHLVGATWSVVRNGVGDYTITFPAMANPPGGVVLPASSVTGLRYSTFTMTTARFLMSADSDFVFVLVGK